MIFEPYKIYPLNRPTIIVGEKPGKTKDGSNYSLRGNRTGDFVEEAISDKKNIILTNIVNELYVGIFCHDSYKVAAGLLDLKNLMWAWNPKKVITLGSIADRYINVILPLVCADDCKYFNMPHPSFINRFQSSKRSEYIKMLSNEIL